MINLLSTMFKTKMFGIQVFKIIGVTVLTVVAGMFIDLRNTTDVNP